MLRNNFSAKKGVKAENIAEKLAYIPDNWIEYPDFGAQNRPSGYKTLSQISLKEIHKYEFAGVCCDTYGGSGYLFKPVNKQFREI